MAYHDSELVELRVRDGLETESLGQTEASRVSHSCDPCVFFFSRYGCAEGDQCAFCHIHHAFQGQIEEHFCTRPNKLRRAKIKHAILLQMVTAKDLTEMQQELQRKARSHPYVRTLIEGYLILSYISSHNVSIVFSL